MSEVSTLFRLAAQLEDHAAAARTRARRMSLGATQVGWHSTAADVFRSRANQAANGLLRSASGLEHAAEALRRHARTVRRVEAVARAAEEAAGTVVHGVSKAARFATSWI